MIKKITLLLLFVVAFSWQGTAQITIGTGTATQAVPINPYFGYSYSQSIYLASEIAASGNITELSFQFNGNSTIANSTDWVIYVGHTTKTEFTSTTDWVAAADMTEVFNGAITVQGSGSAEWVTIDITDFTYNGTDNLVIAVDENNSGLDDSADDFYATAVTGDRSLYKISDSIDSDPAAPVEGTTQAYIANVILGGLTPSTSPNCDAALTTTTNASFTDIAWSAATGTPTGYKLTVGTTTGATDIENATDVGNVTSYAFTTPLALSTTYYVTITPYNDNGDATGCAEQTFTTRDSYYCTPQSTSDSTYIDTFTTTSAGNDINNTGSGYSTDGYANNISMFVDGAADGTFDFFVGDVGGTVGCSIWVDWNNDFTFDPATETVFTTSSYGDDFTGTITIPSGTANGDYTMRVMIDWSDSDPSDDACAFASTRGEVEDYTIRVDNTLGVQNTAIAGFAYYPNPVNNQLSLRANNAIDQVEVLNILGQTVLTAKPSTTSTAIDMTALNQGTYFVRVQAGDAIQTVKVTKN